MFEAEEAQSRKLEELEQLIKDRLTPERQAALDKSLDIGHDEWFAFQTVQAQRHAAGELSLSAANFVHTALGQSRDHFNAQPLAVKVLVTQIMSALLETK